MRTEQIQKTHPLHAELQVWLKTANVLKNPLIHLIQGLSINQPPTSIIII